ncbi:MAG: hypothetical protein ACREF5_00510 [Candidatus Saccharimonadales bacterium]
MSTWRKLAIFTTAFFAVGFLAAGSTYLFTRQNVAAPTASSNTAPTTIGIPFAFNTACVGQKEDVVTIDLQKQGYSTNQFDIGTSHFNLYLSGAKSYSSGPGDFTSKPLDNSSELEQYLQSGSSSAKAQISKAMSSTSATEAQVLDISNWEGFQMLVPSKWSSNNQFVNGQSEPGPDLKVPAGDIGWVFVNPVVCSVVQVPGSSTSSTVTLLGSVKTDVVRGPCGNEEGTLPTPVSPPPKAPPSAPPSAPPTTPPVVCTKKCCTGVCTTKTEVSIPVQQQNPGISPSPKDYPSSAPSQSPDPSTYPSPSGPTNQDPGGDQNNPSPDPSGNPTPPVTPPPPG